MEITITGIDMFSAFVTHNRRKLLETLQTFIDEDELKIIQFLLSNIYLHAKVNNATEIKKFHSNVSTH